MEKIDKIEEKIRKFKGSEDEATKMLLSVFSSISSLMSKYIDDEQYEECIVIQEFVNKIIEMVIDKFRDYDLLSSKRRVFRLRVMANDSFGIGR